MKRSQAGVLLLRFRSADAPMVPFGVTSRLWFPLFGILALGACGGDVEGEPEDLVRKVVGRGGGLVSSQDGVLTLQFPPGALEENVTIEIFPSDTPPPTIGGVAYRVKPDIDLYADVEVTYRRVLPSDPSGVTVAAIRRIDYEAGRGDWRPLERTELDVDAQLVAGLDGELSLYYSMLEDGYVDMGSDTDTMPTSTSTDTGTTTGDAESTTTSTTEVEPASSSEAGDGLDASSGTSGSGDAGGLSYAVDIEPIMLANCLGLACHSSRSAASPELESPGGRDRLVDVQALFAGLPYVAPGEPDGSYLVHKINNTQNLPEPYGCGCGQGTGSMPQGRELLEPEVRELIEQWIAEGAAP